MIIHEITEECFKKYGKVIDSIDLTELVSTMQTVEIPADVVYEPSISALEKLKCATELQQKTYGELPIQIGWCIGNNHKLNAVEYHRCSEVNIAATDAILILGRQQDISVENTYDTSLMEAFRIPSGDVYKRQDVSSKNFFRPQHTQAHILCRYHNYPLHNRLVYKHNSY